jgi:hypothetical protein
MSEVESVKQEPQFAAFIGIDWADKKHAWCLRAVGSEKRESGELEHSPEAVEAWVGRSAVPTIRQSPHRRGGGAIAGSPRLRGEQI